MRKTWTERTASQGALTSAERISVAAKIDLHGWSEEKQLGLKKRLRLSGSRTSSPLRERKRLNVVQGTKLYLRLGGELSAWRP